MCQKIWQEIGLLAFSCVYILPYFPVYNKSPKPKFGRVFFWDFAKNQKTAYLRVSFLVFCKAYLLTKMAFYASI